MKADVSEKFVRYKLNVPKLCKEYAEFVESINSGAECAE